jgi:hypothetical protein
MLGQRETMTHSLRPHVKRLEHGVYLDYKGRECYVSGVETQSAWIISVGEWIHISFLRPELIRQPKQTDYPAVFNTNGFSAKPIQRHKSFSPLYPSGKVSLNYRRCIGGNFGNPRSVGEQAFGNNRYMSQDYMMPKDGKTMPRNVARYIESGISKSE